MKPQTLPTKRRPVSNGFFKRLRAVTGNRRQRVAASAAAGDMEMEDGSSKISRALTIIFLIHIVAIGLIFVHQKFLDGRAPDEIQATTKNHDGPVVANASVTQPSNLPVLSSGEKGYFVRQGDNYARIAAAMGVDENDLRLANQHVDIKSGTLLRVPPKRVTIAEPAASVSEVMPEVVESGENELLETVPFEVADVPRAKVVQPLRDEVAAQPKPKTQPKPKVTSASGKTYIVKNGDNIWKIANKFKVNQAELMKTNGISDARKMKIGTSLVIPN